MPCIKDDSTVEALARAFTSNGRVQERAMIEVGYTPAYANSYCGTMWENPRLVAAIARIDSAAQALSVYNYKESMRRKQAILAAIQPKIDEGNLDAARTAGPYLKQMDNISGLEQQHLHQHGASAAPERTEAEIEADEAAARAYKLHLA